MSQTYADARGNEYRICTRCGVLKRLEDDFTTADRTGRRKKKCKSCENARARLTRAARVRKNPEAERAKQQAWRERLRKDPEKLRREREHKYVNMQNFRKRHPEREAEYKRSYRERLKADPRRHAEYLENRRIASRAKREAEGYEVKRSMKTALRLEPKTAETRVPAAPLLDIVEQAAVAREASWNELGRELGTSARTFYAWRFNERAVVNIDTADKIISGLGFIWEDVFDDKTCERLRAVA